MCCLASAQTSAIGLRSLAPCMFSCFIIEQKKTLLNEDIIILVISFTHSS